MKEERGISENFSKAYEKLKASASRVPGGLEYVFETLVERMGDKIHDADGIRLNTYKKYCFDNQLGDKGQAYFELLKNFFEQELGDKRALGVFDQIAECIESVGQQAGSLEGKAKNGFFENVEKVFRINSVRMWEPGMVPRVKKDSSHYPGKAEALKQDEKVHTGDSKEKSEDDKGILCICHSKKFDEMLTVFKMQCKEKQPEGKVPLVVFRGQKHRYDHDLVTIILVEDKFAEKLQKCGLDKKRLIDFRDGKMYSKEEIKVISKLEDYVNSSRDTKAFPKDKGRKNPEHGSPGSGNPGGNRGR